MSESACDVTAICAAIAHEGKWSYKDLPFLRQCYCQFS